MDWNQLKSDLTEKYNYLSLEANSANLKESCKSLFNDLVYLKSFKGQVDNLINFVIENFRLLNNEILDKYDDTSTTKIFMLQIAFFMSFYSFIVVNFSYEIDESLKDDFVSWAFDILSSLNIAVGLNEWKIFMKNFVLSFSDTLSKILFEIFEISGLDIPENIAPKDYKIDNEEAIFLPDKVTSRKTEIKANKNKVETVDVIEKPVIRALFSCDMSLNQTIVKKKSRKSESSRRKSAGDAKKEKKERKDKKNRRKSVAPETPNTKLDLSDRHERPKLAAKRVLKGKRIDILNSPIPNRAPLTPTVLRQFRSVYSLTDMKLRKLSTPITHGDKWLRKIADGERSLTQFSSESNDLYHEDIKILNLSSIPVTRFKSKFSDLYKTPDKTINDETSNSLNNIRTISTKTTPQKRFFSPIKSCSDRLSFKNSPLKSIIKSPSKTNKANFFSPVKSKKLNSPLITVFETDINKTPLKSCLKSPLPDRSLKRSTSSNCNKRPSKRQMTETSIGGSVLMSPKVKQRLFISSQPSSDFCEDTMFMNTKDFIQTIGSRNRKKQIFKEKDSSFSPYFSDQSSSSFTNSPSDRVISSKRFNPSKQLFGILSSDIDAKNILPGSRRSMLVIPNFSNLDPETDISNS